MKREAKETLEKNDVQERDVGQSSEAGKEKQATRTTNRLYKSPLDVNGMHISPGSR